MREPSNNSHGVPSFKNRNILSGYMAGASLETQRTRNVISSRPRVDEHNDKMSLQDALLAKRPVFIKRSQRRVAILKQIQKIREINTEKQESWLNQIRSLSPETRKNARPTFSPCPVVRLFSHKDMVASAKDKYAKLPEVVYRQQNDKKDGRDQINRLRKDIYSRQLSRKIHAGKVSLLHHDRIL